MSSSPSSSIFVRMAPVIAAIVVGFAAGRFTTTSHERPAASNAPVKALPTGGDAAAPTEAPGGARSAPKHETAEEAWNRYANLPRSAEVERELSASLEEMAKHAPERAMALAAEEPSLRCRELLRNAALRGWAATAPDAALAAAMKLPSIDNRAAIAAVMQGAADPQTVIRLGRQITDGSDPVALDYGSLAISALAEHGHFEDAMRFASSGPSANQAQWLNVAFTAWARSQPQQALAALDRISDPGLRHEAQQGLVAGWAESDPASLADHALREPSSDDRNMELGQTLTNWVLRDPVSASQWLSQRDPDPSLDSGLAAVASMQTLTTQRPEVAAEWAQSISDPQLRQSTLRTIGEEWRRRAPATLQQFLGSNSRLTDADRNALSGAQ